MNKQIPSAAAENGPQARSHHIISILELVCPSA